MYLTFPEENSHIAKEEEKRHVLNINLLGLDSNQEKEANRKFPNTFGDLSHTSLLQFPQSPNNTYPV